MLETYGGKSSIAFVFTLVIYHAPQPNQSFLFNSGDEYIIQIHCKTDNTAYLTYPVSRLFLYTCVYLHLFHLSSFHERIPQRSIEGSFYSSIDIWRTH